MKMPFLEHDRLSDNIVNTLADRDAALWLGVPPPDVPIETLVELIALPWQLVLCESTSGALARGLEQRSSIDDPLNAHRGYLHVVASDPGGFELPPRSLPIFMLNGREDRVDEEAAKQGRNAALRRRLNMINVLTHRRPKELVLVSFGEDEPIESLFEVWREGGRALLALVDPLRREEARVTDWAAVNKVSIDYYPLALADFVPDLKSRLETLLPSERVVIRMRHSGQIRNVDITGCDLIEQPIRARYEIITAPDLTLIQPEALNEEELRGFFEQSTRSWKPYAAGLPWPRLGTSKQEVLKALRKAERDGYEANSLFYVPCQPGAGGTTLARDMAFTAASEGYPTLIAREGPVRPTATELTSFLFRVQELVRSSNGRVIEDNEAAGTVAEIPWLLVFDAEHWEGRESQLRLFVRDLARAGRSIIVFLITQDSISEHLENVPASRKLESLTHDLQQQEALDLGHHLNKFLTVHGRQKSDQEWRSFWENHRPRITAALPSFWVALEFWLRGLLQIGDSIQAWMYRQFKSLDASDPLRMTILELAALSVERHPLPEGLMSTSSTDVVPISVALEEARSSAPGLGLVRETLDGRRYWAIAHELLARYLLNATFNDREMLERLDLDDTRDPTHLRIRLLGRVLRRRDIALAPFAPLATEFATSIFKLDVEGNAEFYAYWEEILQLLESAPVEIRRTSRTFNHHVAISRRRVATNTQHFATTSDQKRELLSKAIEQIEYSVSALGKQPDDDPDLFLFNSLSLAYQDLANLEIEAGSDEAAVAELRMKATDAARRAKEADASNPYVLEMLARNLLQNGEFFAANAAENAAEALGYLYQALSLERSSFRHGKLWKHTQRALDLLRGPDGASQIERLCRAGNLLGLLARAWLALFEGDPQSHTDNIADFPERNIRSALNIMTESQDSSHWMLLRFEYDLLVVLEPENFKRQLTILDQLEGTEYPMPPQLRLEHAILLHQCRRHHEANQKFKVLRELVRTLEVFVDVPARLRWLVNPDGSQRICTARVAEQRDSRSVAKVLDLQGTMVPFRPEEFGKKRMGTNEQFSCAISFGPMGPFIKPPMERHAR